MKFLFSEINILSLDDIITRFVQIPLHFEELIIEGDFQKKSYFDSNFVAQALRYLPMHIRTVVFAGQFHYIRHSKCRSNPGRYLRHLGEHLSVFLPFLPQHIECLKFALLPNIEFEAEGHQIDSAIAQEFSQLWTKVPLSIHRLDLSDTRFDEPIDMDSIIHMYTSIPSQIVHLSLHQFKWEEYAQSQRDHLLGFFARNLSHLSFSRHQVLKQALVAEVMPSFTKLYMGVKLKSLDFSFNHFDERPFEQLKAFFKRIPSHIEHLNLRGNGLGKFDKIQDLMYALPRQLLSLNLADNGLCYRSEEDFFQLSRALPESIQTLVLFDDFDDSKLMTVRQNYALIPFFIRELSFIAAGEQLLKLVLAGGLDKLMGSVAALSFEQNQLFALQEEVITRLFINIPPSVKRLNLANNQLFMMSQSNVHRVLSALPDKILVNIEKNGLVGCQHSAIQSWFKALPDRTYQVDPHAFSLGHDGRIQNMSSRSSDLYYKPFLRIRVQHQAGRFMLVLGQLARQKNLSAQLLFQITTYLCEQIDDNTKQHVQSLCHKSVSIVPEKITLPFFRVFNLLKIRLLAVKDGCLDLSFCGMHALKLEKDFKQLFWMIPKTVHTLNLRHNGLNHCPKTFSAFSQALKFLPSSIRYLDISANGFAQESSTRLHQKFTHVPASIQYIKFGQQRPVSLRETIDRMVFPSHFYPLYARPSNPLDKMVELLNDYSQSNSMFKRLIYGYWNRRHIPEVNRILFWIAKGYLREVEDILQQINLIEMVNESGALAKISSFLYLEEAKVREPIKIGLL